MRKVPSQYECPLDHCLLGLIESTAMTKYLFNWRITPNMVTAVGNGLRLLSIYFWYQQQRWWFLLSALVSYFLDCLDGHLAREFNQTSVFGDWFDHVGDLIYHIWLVYLIFGSAKFTRLFSGLKWSLLAIMGLLLFLALKHLGCQETMTDYKSSPSLGGFRHICKGGEIVWTRYFGTGTFVLVLYLLATWAA